MDDIRMLVVDGNQELRQSMLEFFGKQDGLAPVREAANGMEALHVLAQEPVDVVITDLIMPCMDGYTLLEEIQKLQLEPRPKTIVVTALGRDDFVMRALERGVSYFMVKPFDMPQLLSRVREIAGQSTAVPSAIASMPALSPQRTQSLD